MKRLTPIKTRRAEIYSRDLFAGYLEELEYEFEKEYRFTYDKKYLDEKENIPVSLTLPLSSKPYTSSGRIFPFFDGLIQEGWLFELSLKNSSIGKDDRMGWLLVYGSDCIGAVSIKPVSS